MAELFPKPSSEDVLGATQRCFPSLNAPKATLMSEGWDSWAYVAAGCIFRIPKHAFAVNGQANERAVMPVLAPLLPLRVPDMEFACDDGPNGKAFVGYRLIRGRPLRELPGFRAPQMGRPLGLFLKVLHSAPTDILGGRGHHDDSWSEDRERGKTYGAGEVALVGTFYERVIRQVFPLISCEARAATKASFESFLADAHNFDYKACIVHSDLSGDHILVDETTGEVTGVIDFGDMELGDPAGDFTTIFAGDVGKALGPEGVRGVIEAYGPEALAFEPRCRFYRSLMPLHEVIGGIELRDRDILESGLRQLAELGRRSQPCP